MHAHGEGSTMTEEGMSPEDYSYQLNWLADLNALTDI